MAPNDREITIDDAMRLSGFARIKLYQLVKAGKLKARKPGGFQIWVDRKSLLDYLATQAKLADTAR